MKTWLLCLLLCLCIAAMLSSTLPVSVSAEPAVPSTHLQRTMSLLATSTPQHRHAVRVLFYGQSITKQEWSGAVADDLRRRFPSADLTIENRAIGGFASDLLVRTVERDVDTFYPDLVIFHDYGGEPNYEAIVATVRSHTTAEMALCNDHMTEGQPADWHDHHSFVWMPEIAAKYGCEFVDIRAPWKQYLKDHNLRPNDLLRDGLHLNTAGNVLMASLVEPYLRYLPQVPAPRQSDVTTYRVGPDVRWNKNRLVLMFDGNRVDLLPAAGSRAASCRILIDGKKPSAFPELYSYTRPGEQPGKDWPWDTGGIIQLGANVPRLVEDWTVRVAQTDPTTGQFRFAVQGSKTGADGDGSSDAPFTSRSGRVVILPQDWWNKNAQGKPFLMPGTALHWRVLPQFVDTYQPPPSFDPAREGSVTLAQGLPPGRHTLELVAGSGGCPPIAAIRVYRPPFPIRP